LVEHTYCRFLTDDEDLTEVGARGQGRMDPCFHVEYARSDLALILPSECCSRIRDSSDQATFFQFVQFWRTSLNCEQCKIDNPLTGVATRFKVRFKVQCVVRSEMLFELLLPFLQLEPVWPFSSDLWQQQGMFTHKTVALSSVNHRLCMKKCCHIQTHFNTKS